MECWEKWKRQYNHHTNVGGDCLNSAMFNIIFVTNHVLGKQFENFLSNPCVCVCVCVFLRVTRERSL